MEGDIMNYSPRPLQMNLELTDACPLHCPQCYVEANARRQMPLETALFHIREAAENGVRYVNLSGGETLCCPHLTELIRSCADYGLVSAVALSGALASREKLRELIEAGVSEIYVSLNGSTKEINDQTRDGYELAVGTLENLRGLCKELSFSYVAINWVMHRCNADDFPQMIRLAEEYEVKELVVMGFKPDAAGHLESFPTRDQMKKVARWIRQYQGPVEIGVESCFSPMRALLGESLFCGNTNVGIERGCDAGIASYSVDADGHYTPCRHILKPEAYRSLDAYWHDSQVLRTIRNAEGKSRASCAGCRLEKYCLPCMDIGQKLAGDPFGGFPGCPLAGL